MICTAVLSKEQDEAISLQIVEGTKFPVMEWRRRMSVVFLINSLSVKFWPLPRDPRPVILG